MAGAIRGTPTAASPLSPCVEADLARHVLSFVLGGLYRRVLLQAGLASAACDRAFERAALRGLRRVRSDGRLLLRELAGMSGDSRGQDDEGTCRSQAWERVSGTMMKSPFAFPGGSLPCRSESRCGICHRRGVTGVAGRGCCVSPRPDGAQLGVAVSPRKWAESIYLRPNLGPVRVGARRVSSYECQRCCVPRKRSNISCRLSI